VKLIRARGECAVFEISKRERRLLSDVLSLYPLIPATHHRLSKRPKTTKANENQRLLEESLAAHRNANRKRVLAMLNEPDRFQTKASGYHLTLSRSEIEWLLQVLNDVRVGSWIALGSPAALYGNKIPLNDKTVSHIRSMEFAGGFEMIFLNARNGWMPNA
jgi:hypothetical protein